MLSCEPGDRPLKSTQTLCPECLRSIPGLVFERGEQVLLERECPEHGRAVAVLENDKAWYFLSNKDAGECFAPDRVLRFPEFSAGDDCCGPSTSCGTDQSENKTCTVLVEVTDACNLACAVCYSESAGDRFKPLEAFKREVSRLIMLRGGLDSLQITGGEATLHPQWIELVRWACEHPHIKKVYLPTNGLVLARRGVDDLGEFGDRLMVLLQFDALDGASNQTLRNADPRDPRQRVVDACAEADIHVQLTMTLSRGVNVSQVEDVLNYALAREHVKVLALQPATWSGRYDLGMDPMDRLTLSDIGKLLVAAQTRGRLREEDLAPIPCSHPNCGWITVFARRFGLIKNVMPYIDLTKVMDDVAYKTMLSTDEVRGAMHKSGGLVSRLGRKLVRSTDLFTVAIKPFMDRWTYDQDRVASCCHHITTTRGEAVSFCEYNAILRRDDPWSSFATKEELEPTGPGGGG